MIRIITDSASDIPKDEVLAHNIEILPVMITHNDKTIKEFYDITPQEYHKLLLDSEEIPKTSQVSIEAFKDCYYKMKESGCKKLLYVSINANGSGTFQAGNIARDMFYEEQGEDMQIELVDSQTYSYVYGKVVVECSKMAKQGVSFEDIINFAKETLPKTEGYLGVFDLKFLKKSGRISGGAAFIGEALGLRPISLVGEGGVTVCEKVRGDLNVCKKIISKVAEKCTNPENQTAFIVHGICEEQHLEYMEKELKNTLKFQDTRRIYLGASITTNTGPKAVAVFYQK